MIERALTCTAALLLAFALAAGIEHNVDEINRAVVARWDAVLRPLR